MCKYVDHNLYIITIALSLLIISPHVLISYQVGTQESPKLSQDQEKIRKVVPSFFD